MPTRGFQGEMITIEYIIDLTAAPRKSKVNLVIEGYADGTLGDWMRRI